MASGTNRHKHELSPGQLCHTYEFPQHTAGGPVLQPVDEALI